MSIPGFEAAERSFERLRISDCDSRWDRDIARERDVDADLEELLADEGSVEEAIQVQSDCIRAVLASDKASDQKIEEINRLIRSHLDSVAVAIVERRGE